jgi:hypothetical protein
MKPQYLIIFLFLILVIPTIGIVQADTTFDDMNGMGNYVYLQSGELAAEHGGGCSLFTRTIVDLIPGFLSLIILIAGALVFVFGYRRAEEQRIKIMILSFIIIILGLVFVSSISGIIISVC